MFFICNGFFKMHFFNTCGKPLNMDPGGCIANWKTKTNDIDMEKKHEKTITHIHIDMLRFQNDASLTIKDTNKDIVFFFNSIFTCS